MSKRSAEESAGGASGGGNAQPPIKKVHFEPHLIGPVSTLEEMDIKVLQFQNKKLAQVNNKKKFQKWEPKKLNVNFVINRELNNGYVAKVNYDKE